MQTLSDSGNILRFQVQLLHYGSFFTALFLVAIYLSTSLAIILSCVVGVLWLLSGQFKRVPGILKKQPVATWSLLLYAVLLIGLSYGNAPHEEALSTVKKYREFLFIAILVSFFGSAKYRDRAWVAFMIASVLTLAISYGMYFGWLPVNDMHDPSLKSRITHSIFMAFFLFYCVHLATDDKRYRWVYLFLAIATAYNLFFIVEGRTGQLIALILMVLYGWQRFSSKGRVLSVLAVSVFLAAFVGFSDKASRIHEGWANTRAYMQDGGEQTQTSMGQRYTFWRNSLTLIAEKPLFGHGTGSFATEYARVAEGERFFVQHPHNEFVLFGVQLGLMGLIPYLGFLGSQLHASRRLPVREKRLAQGLLAALLITSLFNTPFFDHTEGHWFAVMIALCFAALDAGDKTATSHD